MNDGFNQRLVLTPARSGDGAGGRVENFANGLAALGYIDYYKGFAQSFGVVGWLGQYHWRLAVQNTVAAAGVACLYAGNLQRNNRGIKQRNHPADRPHIALRLARAPVHIFGPVKAENFLG